MSGKSVVFGWLQAFLIVFGIVNCVWGGVLLAEQQRAANNATDGAFKLVLGLMSFGVWVLFKVRPLRANEERANQLLDQLGIAPPLN